MTVNVTRPTFPAASTALNVRTFVPGCRAIAETLHVNCPDAVPLPPRSLDHWTVCTATLSDATPATATLPPGVEKTVPEVGLVKEIAGAAESIGAPVAGLGEFATASPTGLVGSPPAQAAKLARTVRVTNSRSPRRPRCEATVGRCVWAGNFI